MDNKINQFDIKELGYAVITNPVPESCKKIADIFSNLPPKGSLSSSSPTFEQKQAFEMLKEIAKDPKPDEVRFMAEVCSDKYHRIRYENHFWPQAETAKKLYQQYYDMTGIDEVKFILENFKEFCKVCYESVRKRQRKDDFNLYRKDTTPSTSRDLDSSEWKK